jgi:hypothetical protein
MTGSGKLILRLVAVAGVVTTSFTRAQTAAEVARAFVDLHDDKVPHNCEFATDWLFRYREQLKDQLIAELYKTDWQGRGAILHVLYHTGSFTPDQRFVQFVTAGLPERETGYEDWQFIDQHFAIFEKPLQELLGKTIDRPHGMFVLWAATWMAVKHQRFDEWSTYYTPEIFQFAAKNLKDDDKPYNASQACRFFLIMKEKGVPTLRETAKTKDAQAVSFARALMDGLNGSRDAFGFIGSKTVLETAPCGPGIEPPEWHRELVLKYENRDTYP